MIKKATPFQYKQIMEIWLQSNLKAHDFIPASYWHNQYDLVNAMIPHMTLLIYEDGGLIKGVAGVGDSYSTHIDGIFVNPEFQNQGIGKELIAECKRRSSSLTLKAYAKNIPAVRFFKNNGFEIQKEAVNPETNQLEYMFFWVK